MLGNTIVFDLDGTLVDTAPDLFNTLDHLLANEALPPVDRDAIRSTISFGAKSMIEAAFRPHRGILDDDQMKALTGQFIEIYSANIAVDSRPFPSMVSVLEGLKAKGATLAVCTNKRELLTFKLLDALNLTRLFTAIAAADTFAVSKPHPDHLLKTIERANGNPARSVMVGDSFVDFETAQAAKVPAIAVDFGYSQMPVAHYGPDAIISHYNDLPETVAKLLPQ